MAACALIFDLDGTIWDSAGWFASALSTDAEQVAVLREQLVTGGNIIGALQSAGITRSRLLQQAQTRGGPPPLFDGMQDVLNTLTARGTPLGIATSLPGSIALPMLDACGLSQVFGTVVHAGLCRAAKPHPTSILMALDRLGLPPSPDVFYVGDRETDRVAASRAGVSFAWLRHGYEQPPAGADFVPVGAGELLGL